MASRIQFRRDLAANWLSVDPVLAQSEFGIETDTLKVKIGDGVLAWSLLGYFVAGENTGDQVGDGATITGAGTVDDPFVASGETVVTTEVTVDTPVWANQPTIVGGGNLDAAFLVSPTDYYYVTLKETDGAALPADQFKLMAILNGFGTAVNQVFTLAGLATGTSTLIENYQVDFKAIGASWTLRNAGVVSIVFNTAQASISKLTMFADIAITQVNTNTQAAKVGLRYTGMTSQGDQSYFRTESMIEMPPPVTATANKYMLEQDRVQLTFLGNIVRGTRDMSVIFGAVPFPTANGSYSKTGIWAVGGYKNPGAPTYAYLGILISNHGLGAFWFRNGSKLTIQEVA